MGEKSKIKIGKWFEIELNDAGVPVKFIDNRPYRAEEVKCDGILGRIYKDGDVRNAVWEHIMSGTVIPEGLLKMLREKAEMDDASWERREAFIEKTDLDIKPIEELIERSKESFFDEDKADRGMEDVWLRSIREESLPKDHYTSSCTRYSVWYSAYGLDYVKFALWRAFDKMMGLKIDPLTILHPTLIEILEKRYSNEGCHLGITHYDNFEMYGFGSVKPEDNLGILERIFGGMSMPIDFKIKIEGFMQRGCFIEARGPTRSFPIFVFDKRELYYGTSEPPKGHSCNPHCELGGHAIAIPQGDPRYSGIFRLLDKNNPIAAAREADMAELKDKGKIKPPENASTALVKGGQCIKVRG